MQLGNILTLTVSVKRSHRMQSTEAATAVMINLDQPGDDVEKAICEYAPRLARYCDSQAVSTLDMIFAVHGPAAHMPTPQPPPGPPRTGESRYAEEGRGAYHASSPVLTGEARLTLAPSPYSLDDDLGAPVESKNVVPFGDECPRCGALFCSQDSDCPAYVAPGRMAA